MITWKEPSVGLPKKKKKKATMALWEIIEIKLRSSVVTESKQRAVKFAVRHEIRYSAASHGSTKPALSRIAQDNQKKC